MFGHNTKVLTKSHFTYNPLTLHSLPFLHFLDLAEHNDILLHNWGVFWGTSTLRLILSKNLQYKATKTLGAKVLYHNKNSNLSCQ
jgi:hypothetical protein